MASSGQQWPGCMHCPHPPPTHLPVSMGHPDAHHTGGIGFALALEEESDGVREGAGAPQSGEGVALPVLRTESSSQQGARRGWLAHLRPPLLLSAQQGAHTGGRYCNGDIDASPEETSTNLGGGVCS